MGGEKLAERLGIVNCMRTSAAARRSLKGPALFRTQSFRETFKCIEEEHLAS